MKLRNFLYLNTKIVNDYLSSIEGYIYDEEAQSIATSSENALKAGIGGRLFSGDGAHTGKAEEEVKRSVHISDAAKFDKVFKYLQDSDEDEQIKYYECLSDEIFNNLYRDDFLEVLVTARFSRMKELSSTVKKLSELASVFQEITDQPILDKKHEKLLLDFRRWINYNQEKQYRVSLILKMGNFH